MTRLCKRWPAARSPSCARRFAAPCSRPATPATTRPARSGTAMFDDVRPALVVRCAGTADVIRAIEFARSEGLEIAVRGGSHSIPGFSTTEGGHRHRPVADEGRPRRSGTRRVVAQPGLLWQDLDAETQAFGLAATGGLVSTTGVSGFTLGGGIGWLVRKQGLACDHLVGADVVTADGRLVRAGADGDPELLLGAARWRRQLRRRHRARARPAAGRARWSTAGSWSSPASAPPRSAPSTPTGPRAACPTS